VIAMLVMIQSPSDRAMSAGSLGIADTDHRRWA
jgi:hypothetical protein